MSSPRTLPIRVQPLPGEALDSWLEASACRFGTHLGDFLGALAASDYHGRGDPRHTEPAGWLVRMPEEAAARITAMTDLSPARLHAMTLARYDGIALRLGATGRTVDHHSLWGRGTRSRFCPDCLAESGGRWQLWWRLGWAFACPRHQQLLADTCPRCCQPQRQRFAPLHVIPEPGRCAHPPAGQVGLAERRCSGDLTHAQVLSLPEDHPALATQRLLLDAIHAGQARFGIYTDDPLPVADALSDVRALARRILGYATIAELAAVVPADLLAAYRYPPPQPTKLDALAQNDPGFMAPAQAVIGAVGLTAAFTVLGAPTVAEAGACLRWLIDGCRRDGLAISATSTRVWGRGTTRRFAAVQLAALDSFLDPSDRLRYRTTTAYPRRPDPGVDTRRAPQVPTLFWPDWALRLWLPGVGYAHHRLALSCALLVIGTRFSLRTTVLKLGTPTTGVGIGRVLQLMQNDPSWPPVSEALTRLADYLDTHDIPIDYERRGQLDYDDLLPDDTWIRWCHHQGRYSARQRSAAVARAVLFERLSGLPADQAPGANDSMDFRAHVGSFPRRLDPELALRLDRAAQDHLHQQGVVGEPVTWQPPLDLLEGLRLPGPDPTRIDPAALHQAVRQPDTSLETAAAQLDTTIDVVRHLLLQHPLPHRAATRYVRSRIRSTLSRTEFVQLYEEQRLALHEIAAQLGVSRGSVARIAREYGIPLRPVGRTAPQVDVEWLREQYVVRHRTLPDIARELDVPTMTLNRWAHQYAIPLRPRGGGSHRGKPRQAPGRVP